MGLEINPQWSFKELVEHIWTLRDEFDRLLASFSYFDLHEKVMFLKTTRDTIYSMNFEEWRKDKVWNYFNHYEYYTTLLDMANRMK